MLACGIDFHVSGRPLAAGTGSFPRTIWEKWLTGLIMVLLAGILLFPALFGLIRPLLHPPQASYLNEAKELFIESMPVTLLYGCTAGLIAGSGAFLTVVCMPRSGKGRALLLFVCLFLFALPPSLNALGMLRIGTSAPAWLDFLFRSGWVVGVGEGLHFLPLGIVFLLVAWQRVPYSLQDAARLHGVPNLIYAFRIAAPAIIRPLVVVILVCGLLALADVTSTVLLQPPGGSSYGTHLFAIMDNSSEKLVAAFCLVYMLVPLVVFGGVYMILCPKKERA
jgi:ABC-type Fe3+ transport system permease subunit